jgi:hypothetical protein
MTMLKEITTNCHDWSGDVITVPYIEEENTLRFELNGYEWEVEVEERSDHVKATLNGDEWDHSLVHWYWFHGFRCEALNESFTPEEAVKRAIIYIRNHV